MNFQADLFTGRFAYSVPIAVAPARQGAEPKIVLGYNSAAGNGWCGVGWTLDMGYIQRDTRHGVPVLSGSTAPASQGLSAASVNYSQQHGYKQGDSLTLVGGTLQWGSPARFNVTQVDGGGRVVQLQLCCIGSPIYFAYATVPPNLVSFTGGSLGNDGSAQANIAWAGGSPLFVTAVPVAHPYQPGDLLQIQGGVGFPATVRVVTVNAIGEPDQLQVVNSGCYSTLPPSPNSPTGGSGSGVQLNLSFGPGIPSEYDDTIVVSKASVNYPYAGYKVGDGLSLVGGTAKSGCNPYAFQVTQVVNGQITQLQLWEPIGSPYITYGPYAAFPNNPVSFTGGSGNGAQANITWTSSGGYWNATSWTVPPVAGSSYQPNDPLQIQGGVGTPAEVKVLSVNAYGEPDQLQVVNCGQYSTPPPNPNSPTGGHGSGVQLNLTFLGVSSGYDDSKGFISSFGGASSTLVQVGPTNQNPIIYRQQVDTSFLTYEYFTNDYWEVIDKSGNQFFFGEGITNQMENPKPGWTQGSGSSTWRWALDRVVDANGNETFLNYTLDNGMLYLTNILYNANLNSPALAASDEVDFILTNRPDTNFTYISNYRLEMDKLLSEIDVRAGGKNVRKYVLGYTNSPSTLRSLLASVTQYGSNFTTALPPITFGYQVESLAFGPDINWPGVYSQGDTGGSWNAIRATDGSDDYVNMIDVDGDGLPDRVMREYSGPPYTNYFAVQRNTGSGFAPAAADQQWGPLNSQGDQGYLWNSPAAHSGGGDNYYYAEFLDINGDGYPDRVMQAHTGPYTNFVVQYNTGIEGNAGFTSTNVWGPITNTEISIQEWLSLRYLSSQIGLVDLVDMNGDGLPDWVNSLYNSPFDRFRVELNNGSGFSAPVYWGVLDSQGDSSQGWNSLSGQESSGNYCVLMDINGDGLPDRVMRDHSPPYTNFIVQFNNGAGFEPAQNWGPINTQGQSNNLTWGEVVGTDNSTVWAQLVDINGDGLPDRVMRKYSGSYTNWVVQLNTGSGFGPAINWGPLNSQNQTGYDWNSISASSSGATYVDFFDINGDGLPDRIMRMPGSGPYDHFVVQLNQGPFPDLLNVVSNGLGGNVQVSYIPSTTLNNRDKDWTTDPWAEGAKSLLPFNIWVVTNVVVNDGMGNSSTNSYAFKGGYYNVPEREFRGFSQCTETDPLGTKTTTYFHQSGGRDNSALGEYLDQGSESKKGIPFRIEVVGSDGATNKITLNKVEEVELNSSGWYFPYISQAIEMTYEGLPSYRATAKQFTYDANTENLLEEVDLGEVTSVVVNGQTFTDVGNDSVYTWMSYTNWGRPSDIKITSDSAGNNRLRETKLFYDSRGNLTGNQVWLDTAGSFITTTSTLYDQYGNPYQATDAAGITTYTTYDSTYQQYPITQTTATFVNQFVYDIRSGLTVEAIDAKGLVASNAFDVFYRSTATYISTTAYGAPTLWKTKTSYSLGGIASGISYNYVHKQANDATDANGFETYAYLDGIGRTIQTRAESETAGQFRVANVVYDKRGNAYFQTLPYFSSGSGFTVISGNNYLGTLTEYDSLGRAYRVTPAVQGNFTSGSLTSTNLTWGDTGSPVGAVTTAFVDGNNPWATVVTDSESKQKKAYRDAYGRTIQITEVTSAGNYNTTYGYDILGNLTNLTDNANNKTTMVYDSLGRKTAMTDPDMGTWTYGYDNAGRITQQIDARNNKLTFDYTDPLGRMVAKHIYNPGGTLAGTITYTYDVSDDPNYTVFKGQLYKVTDLQGYQRSSYDVRGRVVKTARFLNVNSMEYVTQTTYDDADRLQTIAYPGNAATVQYTYDTAGNLVQVKSLAGTGTQEIFYTPQGFNALGQLTGYTDGAGVVTANTYYNNSKRLQRVWAYKGTTNLQDLTYTYDTVSDIKSISDGVYTSWASASINNIVYDDLYRVTSLYSTAYGGTKIYGYNSIGNILTNQDFGLGFYQYGTRPHAVLNANGMAYGYDACGNMTSRGNQTLTYDAENQLIKVATTNDTVMFGYNASGGRLWRSGTNGYSVWIGGIYEINNGKVLCHVFAGGKRLATFEPLCGGMWSKVFGEKNWYLATTTTQKVLAWPFEKGRGQWSMLGGTWVAIFGVCLMAGRKVGRASRLPKRERSSRIFRTSIWRQFITLVSISAFLWGMTPEAHAASAYNPVFYYYHNDNLGSSNVLTDRTGQMVEHYEYATFGKTSYQDNTSAYQVSNRYTGQIFDDETGLYYYGARYYDPQLGRFIQSDTIVPSAGAPQTLNRYSYCNNNPLNFTDPSGHSWFSSVIKSLGKMFSNPLTWVAAAIGFCIGGPEGAAIALEISAGITVISTTVAYVAGPQAGMIAGAVLSIAFACYGIAAGAGMLETQNVEAITTIVSSTLGIGSSAAGLAGDQGLSRDLGYASLGTSVLGAGNNIPLIGGMLGNGGEVLAGLVNTTLAVATFGISGTCDLGLLQLADGLETEWDILSRDAEATFAGIEGKIYVTLRASANLLTFGQIPALGEQWGGVATTDGGWKGFKGAFSDLENVLVPCYGNFNGSGWGIPNFGYDRSLIINQGDIAAFTHDQHGDDWQWMADWYTTSPTAEWVGPIGAAYALFGTGPFALIGLGQRVFDSGKYPWNSVVRQ